VKVDIQKQVMADFGYLHSDVSGGETKNALTFGFNFNFFNSAKGNQLCISLYF